MPDRSKMTKAQLLDELSAVERKLKDRDTEIKKLEEQVERFQSFLDDPIMIGCFEVDRREGITYVNRAVYESRGYTLEEYLKLKGEVIYGSAEEYARIQKHFRTIFRTGKTENIEFQVRNKDGMLRITDTVVSVLRDKAGEPIGFRGVSRDVTERKKMLEELERYREFFENVEDICFEIDLRGNLTFMNQAASLKLGYASKDDLIGMNYRQYAATPEQERRIAKVFNEVYRTGETRTTELDIVVADRKIPLLMSVYLARNAEGVPTGFRGISRDISERRQFEREQERYRNFIENIDDGCYEMDLSGHFQFCNEAALRLIGYCREEMSFITYKDYLSPEDVKRMQGIFNEIYRTGRPKMHSSDVIRKDGGIRTLMTSVSLMRDAEGRPAGFRGIFQDITERKRLEEQETRLIQQLHQAQKLEAIGTLAGGIAHDFNNLLMGIQGYASLMLLNLDSSHPHFERLKAVEAIVQSGSDLTKQLLGYARGGRYEVRPLDLNEVIEKTASMFGRTKKELQIYMNLVPNLWTVEADQGQIEQVLLNLFVNAWQAMPGGGSLYLESNNVNLEEAYVRPYDLHPGPFVKISVTDTGVGMDEQMKSRIFEPFFTTKGMGRGTGIGLASVYGIVRGHKGIITVYSEKGQGANFNIYLPASGKAAVKPEAIVSSENMKGNETILLADDEEMITKVTSEMLKQLGYKVLTARNGEEAVRIYRENPGQIDLVIMDMVMPGGGGGPAVDKISEINPDVKVILSSGYSLNGMIKEVLDRARGANRTFIQKPFMLGDLSCRIRGMLDKK